MHTIHHPRIENDRAEGILEINDPNFGNIWTNIPTKKFLEAGFKFGEMVNLTILHDGKEVFSEALMFDMSFGDVSKGQPIIYNNELMLAALAVNQGSFTDTYQIGYGPDWTVTFTK